jgi:hypothetical protein
MVSCSDRKFSYIPMRPLLRSLLLSLAKRTPVFFIRAAMWVDLPPGAAAMLNVGVRSQCMSHMQFGHGSYVLEHAFRLLRGESHHGKER